MGQCYTQSPCSVHVLNICRSAYTELRQIGSTRHLLTAQRTQTLVCAFILSHLDYCNCVLAGCPQFLIDRVQKVQNAAARLICSVKKLGHVQPILQSLHWLPIRARIQYKISTLCFNYQCNHRHWTTIPLRTSPPVRSL